MSNKTGSPHIQPGDHVAGRFRVVEQIGKGGFSVVYRAYQETMRRFVALKILKQDISTDDNVVERFRREAMFASHLSHPNTITLFDYGRTDGGLCYIAMEYLDGIELGSLVRRTDGFELTRVWSLLVQASQSLAEAHRLGLIHRDLKPENLYLVQQGDEELVKVLDFGLSKAVRDTSAADTDAMTPLTQEGKVFGTPLYMAPEQAQDDPISPAIDVYALGHIAYEMITGQARYAEMSSAMDIMLRQIYDPPLELDERAADTPFADLIQEATRKEPGERFATAGKLHERLSSEAFLDYMPPGPHRHRLEERDAAHQSWRGGLGTESSYVDTGGNAHDFTPQRKQFREVLDEVVDGQQMRVVLINGPRGGGRTQFLYELLEDVGHRDDLALVHRQTFRDGEYEHRGLAADIARLKQSDADSAIDEGPAPMLGDAADTDVDVASELTERESAVFGNLGGRRETIFSKTARLFRARASDQPVVWVLERLERLDAFTLAFLNWFYQDLQTDPAAVFIVATVSRADLVDRAGLLRYTQALLAGTEPMVRRFFISQTAEDGRQMGSGADALHSTMPGSEGLAAADGSDPSTDGGRQTLQTLGVGDSDGDENEVGSLFDRTLGLLANLGDEVPVELWRKVRDELLDDHEPNIVQFIVERAERFGILENADGIISFGRPTFAERLRDPANDGAADISDETRKRLAEMLLEHYDRPDRETIERTVDLFRDAGEPTAAIEALNRAGDDAFSRLDLDSAREYYLRLQHLVEQFDDDAPERIREELDLEPASIWLRIGETHGALDEHGAAEDALQRAADLADERAAALRGRALKLIADLHSARDLHQDAEEHYEAAAAAFHRAAHDSGAAAAESLMGESILRQQKPERAERILTESLQQSASGDMPLVEARTRYRLGRARLRQRDIDGAFELFERAADGFAQLQRHEELVRTEMTFGNAAFGARQFDLARQRYGRARNHSTEVRHFGGDYPTLGLARASAVVGAYSDAADCIDDPDAPDRRTNRPLQRIEWMRHQGDLFLVHGAFPAAGERYTQMAQDAREVGHTELFLDALLRNAFTAYHAESFESAAERFTKAGNFVDKYGSPAQRTITQVLGLYLHAASRDFPNETEDLAGHLESAQNRDDHWVYALTSICMADIRTANGHLQAAGALLERAHKRVTRIGQYRMVASIGHRIDRLGALTDQNSPPAVDGALVGSPAPPEVHTLHPDTIYRAP
jgi:serine/threonine-protein kinase